MPLIASITDPIVNVAVDVVDAMGLPGVFLLMVAESACIPVPSEATMLFAGFNVSSGDFSLGAAVAVGTLGNLVGSWIAYWVGYAGRVDILEKHGKKLHIKPSHLAWADRWFERHGDATVFFTRMLPIIRTFISLPAGVARMPFCASACSRWPAACPGCCCSRSSASRPATTGTTGRTSSTTWTTWCPCLIVAGIAYLVLRARRRRGAGPAATETT